METTQQQQQEQEREHPQPVAHEEQQSGMESQGSEAHTTQKQQEETAQSAEGNAGRRLRPRSNIRPPQLYDQDNFDLTGAGVAGKPLAAVESNAASSPAAPAPNKTEQASSTTTQHHARKRSPDSRSKPSPAKKEKRGPVASSTNQEKHTPSDNRRAKPRRGRDRSSGKKHKTANGDSEEDGDGEESDDGEYCICRQPDDGRMMVSCDACHEWFHIDCVGLTKPKAEKLESFFCPQCKDILEGGPGNAPPKKRPKQASKQKEEAPAKPMCHKCGLRPKREQDSFCSDNCAAQAASDEFLSLLAETGTQQPAAASTTTASAASTAAAPSSFYAGTSRSKQQQQQQQQQRRRVASSSGRGEGVDAFRDVTRNNLLRVVSERAARGGAEALDVDHLVREVEAGIYDQHSNAKKRYLATVRRLVSHFRDRENDLLQRLADGELTPCSLASRDPEELVSKEQREMIRQQKEEALEDKVLLQGTSQPRLVSKLNPGKEAELDFGDANVYYSEPPPVAPLAPDMGDDGDVPPSPAHAASGSQPHTPSLASQQQQHGQGQTGRGTGRSGGTPRAVNVVSATSAFKWEDDEDEEGDGKRGGGYDDDDDGFGDGGATPPGTPPGWKEEDKDAELLKSMTETVFADLAEHEAGAQREWSGEISMADVAGLRARGVHCMGATTDTSRLLGQHIRLPGRIRPSQVWSYVNKLRKGSGKSFHMLALTPETEDDFPSFVTLFQYFKSRDRLGVCGSLPRGVKDAYVLPVQQGADLPIELQKLRLKQARDFPDQDFLLAVVISNERPSSASSSSTHRRHHHHRHHHHHRKSSSGSAAHTPKVDATTPTDPQKDTAPVKEYTPGQILF